MIIPEILQRQIDIYSLDQTNALLDNVTAPLVVEVGAGVSPIAPHLAKFYPKSVCVALDKVAKPIDVNPEFAHRKWIYTKANFLDFVDSIDGKPVDALYSLFPMGDPNLPRALSTFIVDHYRKNPNFHALITTINHNGQNLGGVEMLDTLAQNNIPVSNFQIQGENFQFYLPETQFARNFGSEVVNIIKIRPELMKSMYFN